MNLTLIKPIERTVNCCSIIRVDNKRRRTLDLSLTQVYNFDYLSSSPKHSRLDVAIISDMITFPLTIYHSMISQRWQAAKRCAHGFPRPK